jgi:hypothetical protein
MVGLCGIAAIVIDEGFMWMAKQRAQNIADAGAIAAIHALSDSHGNTSAAMTAGMAVVNGNNAGNRVLFKPNAVDSSGNSAYITFPTSYTADDGTVVTLNPGTAVRVDGYLNAPAPLGNVVGFAPSGKDGSLSSVSVPAHAIALISNLTYTYVGVPFAPVADQPNSTDPTLSYLASLLTNPPPFGTYQTKEVILKSATSGGSTIATSGNFGAVDFPGTSGGSAYRDAIAHGSSAGVYVGQTLSTETGNMVGPTVQGMNDRLNPNNNSFTHDFSSYDQWYFGRSTYPAADPPTVTTSDGVTHNSYKDPEKQNTTDAHLAVVPLITSPGSNGHTGVTVLGFGVFFIDNTNPGASPDVVSGRFIGMVVKGRGGPSGGGGTYTVSLVQ